METWSGISFRKGMPFMESIIRDTANPRGNGYSLRPLRSSSGNLKTYLEMIRDRQSGKPVFLFGHSMGGLIGSIFLLEFQEELKGAILSGPAVKIPENISSGTILAGKVLSILMPRFGLIQLDASHVSRDPAVVQAYIDDPLVYSGKTTARLAAEMLKAMQRVSSEANRITLPILILHGRRR